MEKIKIINICDKISLFSLYAIAFFLPISKALIEIFATLAIASFLTKKIILREKLRKTPLNWAVFIYLFICFFSIFISSNIKVSIRTFFGKTLEEIALFFVIIDTLNTKQRLRNILFVFFISAAVLGIDGVYQYFTHKDFIRNRGDPGLPRIHASFYTANDFGCYLVVLVSFVLACFFYKFRFKIFRFLLALLFILLFICLVLTVSRSAWFGSISSMLFMCIWFPFLLEPLLIFVLFLMLIFPTCPPFLQKRLSNFLNFTDPSSIDRRTIWEAAWRMFKSNPWLGVGSGTFMSNFEKFVNGGYRYGVPYAHNCYLQMVSEIGLFGLASFLAILMIFFYRGIRIIKNCKLKTFSWYALIGSLAGILGYCVQMATDTSFYSLDLGMLFWVSLGIGSAAIGRIKEDIKNTISPEANR